jgi:phage protein D/phage baseplate assembly protein gpV
MPALNKLLDHLYIKLAGSYLPPDMMRDLAQVTVDTSLHLPDMFTILIHDEKMKVLDSDILALGKEVEIDAVPEDGGASTKLIKGEITTIEPDFAEGTQANLLVRGYDRSHRLHRANQSRAYLQVTDSDLAQRIANEAQLRSKVDATNEVYNHVVQPNQTPISFLTERARRIGYTCYVEDRTLHFRKPLQDSGQLELEWGLQLRRFTPRLTLTEQVDEVIVRGWDPKTREVIVGRATSGRTEPELEASENGPQLASAAFDSTGRRVIVNRPVNTQAEADALAQATFDEISGTFVEAEGLCVGQPTLRAGKYVKLTKLGKRFSGVYLATAVTHMYRADTSFTTTFHINGQRPETLQSLLERPAQPPTSWFGPVIGVVTNNNDPEDWGRVKVKFPWLSDQIESNWARLVSAGAGAERGCYWLPEINDEVMVLFEHGDINRPIVVGNLWTGKDKPPLPIAQALESSMVRKRTFTTRVGHRLTFTDGTGKGVVLETAGQHRLTLADEDKKVVLETAGQHRLTLADEDKKVVLETAGGLTLTMDDTTREIRLESPGNVTVKSGANLTVKSGANMTLEATGMLVIRGAMVQIN